MSADPIRLERRVGQRFELHLPLAIHFDGRSAPGFTQDLSGRGIFFYAEAAPSAGSVVELTFTMPSEITLAESMRVRCRGRVLRVSPSEAGGQNGIAVRLESYQYLPADERNTIVPIVRPATADPSAEPDIAR
jgi:hypothetical protein